MDDKAVFLHRNQLKDVDLLEALVDVRITEIHLWIRVNSQMLESSSLMKLLDSLHLERR